MATGQVPVGGLEAVLIRAARGLLVRSFLTCFDRRALAAKMRDVVSWKVQDPNMSNTEVAAMWRLVERDGVSG
jgi:hypothetical protein